MKSLTLSKLEKRPLMRYLLLFTLLFLNLKTFAASLSLEDQNSKASNFLFIGLSSSAKSTLANTLREKLENSENIRIHSFDTHANLFHWLSEWNYFSSGASKGSGWEIIRRTPLSENQLSMVSFFEEKGILPRDATLLREKYVDSESTCHQFKYEMTESLQNSKQVVLDAPSYNFMTKLLQD